MAEGLAAKVEGLRRLAASLPVTGETGEQSLLLAIIGVLDDFARAIDAVTERAPSSNMRPDDGVLTSHCPNCGNIINLDIGDIHGDGSVVCDKCHEIIGVISDEMS